MLRYRLRRGCLVVPILLLALTGASANDTPAAVMADYDRLALQVDGNVGPGWPDVRPRAVAGRLDAYRQLRSRLLALPAGVPGSVDDDNRRLLDWRLQILIEGANFDEERIPFDNGDGFFNTAVYAAAQTVPRSAEEALAWIDRIAALPDYYAAQTENLRRGIATGFTQPRVIVEGLLPVLRLAAEQPVEASPLLAPLERLPATVPAEVRAQLRDRARETIAERVKPAQVALVHFFETDYLRAARITTGARSLPDGEAYYRFLVRRSTTLSLTPEEIEALGRREVDRLTAEMTAAMRETGWTGSLPDFIAHLRTDPRFYAPDLPTYVAKASEIGKRVDGLLPLWFGKLPRLTWTLRQKPPEQDASSSGYDPGTPQAGIAGAVVVGSHAHRDPLFSLPAWILHEGVPGHHLQIALAQERSDLPSFRRKDDVTAFVEGWALYAEGLGEDMGVYRDPYERFGRLAFNVWRACRLIMDVGIHWHGVAPEAAEACLLEHTTLPRTVADYETARYTAWPAQALAYKVGELHLLALRERAAARLGSKFDLKAFHDCLIDDGPMPLPLLSEHVERWIAARATAPANPPTRHP